MLSRELVVYCYWSIGYVPVCRKTGTGYVLFWRNADFQPLDRPTYRLIWRTISLPNCRTPHCEPDYVVISFSPKSGHVPFWKTALHITSAYRRGDGVSQLCMMLAGDILMIDIFVFHAATREADLVLDHNLTRLAEWSPERPFQDGQLHQ